MNRETSTSKILFSQRLETSIDTLRRKAEHPLAAFLLILPALLSYPWQNRRADPDLFARLAVGRLIVRDGRVPLDDPFSFTPTLAKWIDHEWLAGLIFFFASSRGADLAMFLLKIFFCVATVLVLILAQREATKERIVNVPWLLLAAWPTVYVWGSTIRSQVFTYFLLSLVLFLVASWLQGRRPVFLFFLPCIFPLFANAHGGFVVPLGFLAIGLLGRCVQDRTVYISAILIPVLAFAFTLLNPYGLAYWEYLFKALTMSRPGIIEWQAISLTSFFGIYILLMLALLLYFECQRAKGLRIAVVILLLISAAAAFRSGRFLAVFFFVATVFGADAWRAFSRILFAHMKKQGEIIARACMLAFLALSLTVAVLSLARHPITRPFSLDYSRYPVKAFETLYHCAPSGNLLVHFNHGSFALWRLFPKFLVSVDGRYEELYPQETLDTVQRALSYNEPGQAQALAAINAKYILLDKSWKAANAPESYAPGFSRMYEDEQFLLLADEPIDCPPETEGIERPLLEPSF